MYLLQITKEASKVAGQTISYIDKVKDFAIDYAPKIVGAVLFYVIGTWIINKLVSMIRSVLLKRNYDPSLQTFLVSLVRVVLTILLLISIAGKLGADTTAFSALIVGAGVAIGSALNGTLGNFAGGVMMLVFKPFRVGDLIEAQGVTGVVTEQGVFSTTVLTAENKTVYLPNGALSTNTISNYTAHGNLRVDITMAIAPSNDLEKVKSVTLHVLQQHPKVLQTPAPEVNVLKAADGMLTLAIRPYCVQADYWDVFFGCTENIVAAFAKEGIEGPTPTRIVINK